MESDLVSGSLSLLGEDKSLETNLSLITYTEQFYSHLPFYLSIGMTYEQYWNEDCCLVKYYRSTPTTPATQTKPTTTTKPSTTKKSDDEIAKEVIEGKWGNGEDRKKRLTSAGYNYNTIQRKVNALLSKPTPTKSVTEIAKEVINGKWGNGSIRKQRLTKAGYDYDTVQREVNRLLK